MQLLLELVALPHNAGDDLGMQLHSVLLLRPQSLQLHAQLSILATQILWVNIFFTSACSELRPILLGKKSTYDVLLVTDAHCS